jgi:hypothetical protein
MSGHERRYPAISSLPMKPAATDVTSNSNEKAVAGLRQMPPPHFSTATAGTFLKLTHREVKLRAKSRSDRSKYDRRMFVFAIPLGSGQR